MKTYILEQGAKGAERLELLARVVWPSTSALLDRAAIRPGMKILEAGCGIGRVSLELARRVAPAGRVLGLDLDEAGIAQASAEARELGLPAEFRAADILREVPEPGTFDLAYARFLLSHLADPARGVAALLAALKPGGMLLVEDVDFAGHFSHPSHWAFDRYVELYRIAASRRGADALIGPKLPGLLMASGATDVGFDLRQPAFHSGEGKRIGPVTLAHIRNALTEAGIATPEDVDATVAALESHAADPSTILSLPRIFQVWGRKA